MERGCLLQNLVGTRAGPQIWGLLQEFWDKQEVVTQQGGFHGTPFNSSIGTTQGDLSSLTLFNVVLESVIRHWMSLTIENPDAIHNIIGETVGHKLGVFYTDDDMISSRNPEWIQGAIKLLIGFFRRISLEKNIEKSKTMLY